VRIGVVGALSAWGVFQAAERFPEYFGPIVAATSVHTVEGLVTRVRDGDTVVVGDVPIRLGSLDCSEMNTTAGQRAAGRMRSLVSAETLTCHLNGRESYDRKIGSCRLPDGRDVAAVMIQEGLCDRFW
jgi:endonuclease YncB( thermonuclease family)